MNRLSDLSEPLASARADTRISNRFHPPRITTVDRSSVLIVASVLAILVIASILRAEPPAPTKPIDPHNPPEGLFSDEWSEIYMADKKVGYAHSTMSRQGDRIRTSTQMKMDLGRVGQSVGITLSQYTTETLTGEPIEFGSETKMAAITTVTKGTIADGKVTIVSSQFGMEQTQSFDFSAGAVMTWGAYRESLLRGFKAGTAYDLKVYVPDMRMDDAIVARTKVGEMETFEHRGSQRRGRRVSVTMISPIGELKLLSWVREDGQPIKSVMPLPGMGNLTVIEADQKTALTDFVPPEIFLASAVKAGRSIDRARTKRITYLVTRKTPDENKLDLPTTGMQTVTRVSDDTVKLVVERQIHKKGEDRAAGSGDTDLAEFKGANLTINTDDPALQALAKRAAGGTQEPFLLADKLRRFVTQYVTTKNLNIGFATASEVCRLREGDCSEHAVLLAALGRLNGLPSRVVVGLAYIPQLGGKRDIFGYHMWTQFFIDHRWIDVDAALRETECSPARIVFAVSSLKNAGLVDLTMPLLSRIGATEIKIVEVEPLP